MNYILPPVIIAILKTRFSDEDVKLIDRAWYGRVDRLIPGFRMIGCTQAELFNLAETLLRVRAIDCEKIQSISHYAVDKLSDVAIIESKADEKVAPNLNLTAKECIMTVTVVSAAAKSFKPFTGVTAKEATAKMLAGKATKAMGVEYVVLAVKDGFTIGPKTVELAPAAAAAAPKAKKASAKDWAGTAARTILAKLSGMGATKEDLTIEDGKTFKIKAKGQVLTWFAKREWADEVVTRVGTESATAAA